MSDHWNSIANLLKTPSLGPTVKKSEGPPKPPKATAPVEQLVQAEQPVSPVPEPAKPKIEPSRLRSSWDAVATFFGVAAPEQALETPAQQDTASLSKAETSTTTRSSSSGSRKTKPSMWAETVDDRTAATEPSPPPRSADPSVLSHENDSRVRSRGNDRGPRANESESRTDMEPRRVPQTKRDEEFGAIDPERRSIRQQPRRGRQADVRAEAPLTESGLDEGIPRIDSEIPDQDDSPRSESSRTPRGRGQRSTSEGGDVRPERSSERISRPVREERPDRPPRAGSGDRQERSARPDRNRPHRAARQDSTEQSDRQPRSEDSAHPARSESSDRPIKSDRPIRSDREERPNRTDRAERPPRAEGAERSERPARQERPDGNERPVRTDRVTRNENVDRAASRDRPARPERTSSPRGERAVRDGDTDRRPSSTIPPTPKKPAGFGAGIHEDDSFEFVEDSLEIRDDFELVDDRVELDSDDSGSRETIERESRPRRRRGRGKRSEIRDDNADTLSGHLDSDEDSESDEDASELIGRNSRIPSWQDAIGTLVATNMENHQRNQSQNRGPRGRSPRRDR